MTSIGTPKGVKAKKPKPPWPLRTSSACTMRFGGVATRVIMPLTRAAIDSGMNRRPAAMALRRAIRVTTGMKSATTPVELMNDPVVVTIVISNATRRVSLEPARSASQSPARRAIPVRTRASPTTNSSPIRMTVGSEKPASASAISMTPVAGRATSIMSPTTSPRGRPRANMATAATSRARTTARSGFMGAKIRHRPPSCPRGSVLGLFPIAREQVAQLGALGQQVAMVRGVEAGDQRNALRDLDAGLLQRLGLAGVVRHQAQRPRAEMLEHGLADVVAPHVGGKAQGMVRLDRVGARVLQAIGADLVQQADAAPLLAQVEHEAAAMGGDALERLLELGATVAAPAEERVAGQAFGVDPGEHRRAVGDVAEAQRDMLLAGIAVDEAVQPEHRPRCRQVTGLDEFDAGWMLPARGGDIAGARLVGLGRRRPGESVFLHHPDPVGRWPASPPAAPEPRPASDRVS